MLLPSFHPALQTWFQRNFEAPTAVQAQAWPAIRAGQHTLIAAPTGSGKTLAAFYATIDRLVWQAQQQGLSSGTCVVYISPLKALGNDIHRNLELPLAGIAEELERQGARPAPISVAVRTGDTPPSERQRMIKNPPHILVTTPESLYLLLTSVRGREMLGGVTSVIVDEIHAMLGDKRGSHLSLSLERLQALVKSPLQRIGLSATQKPISLVADYLTGNGEWNSRTQEYQRPACTVIDAGHRRVLDVTIEVPRSALSALMSNEVWEELYERLLQLINTHQTTLVFVNTRRLAERLALALSERLGEGKVSSHHGSMSREHRYAAEQNLKAGNLQVLVATASMELGIDIGSVDLVVQFSSPKSIATFLQRVGRSGHSVGGTPKGILFPLTRDDLLECTALLDSVHRGELDAIVMPEKPLDILAQQIVAELAGDNGLADGDLEEEALAAGAPEHAAVEGGSLLPDSESSASPAALSAAEESSLPVSSRRGRSLSALYAMCRRAYPYRHLGEQEFQEVVKMLADGYSTRLGRRGAYLHLDQINQRVSARRNARLTALTNGGAIPDMFDYQVVLDPEDTVVGSLNEDFALETLPGDIFALGSHSWQLLRVDGLKVRVRDAHGMKPTVPFWIGEGPGRSRELSFSVSRLRQELDEHFQSDSGDQALHWLTTALRLPESAAQQLLDYLQTGRNALQCMPTQQTLVMERFFDEVGDMHVVIHSPFGSRLNKAWGLALRKRFCRTFNFELQAAANEDSIVISLGSVHSFPLQEVFSYLHSASAEDVLIQALLDAPMFEVRWRWNATRSLAIQRNRSGRRVPPQFQRMDAEDLVAQVFPDQIACFENIQGKRQVPEHPLVRQTIHDCLTEAMDVEALLALLTAMESGELKLLALDLREPSPFAQEIINARPYAFLDDAPFEERRTNAIRHRSWLDPAETEGFSVLDPAAVARVREEAWPLIRDAEELHDALYSLGFMTAPELEAGSAGQWLSALRQQQRATEARIGETLVYLSAERQPCFRAAVPDGELQPALRLPVSLSEEEWQPQDALLELLRGRLDALGPVTAAELAEPLCLDVSEVNAALLVLESQGFVFQGSFISQDASAVGEAEAIQWCERRLLQRIHRYTIDAHRQAIQPVSLQAYACYLFDLHEVQQKHLTPRPQSLPAAGEEEATVQRTLERLDGMAAPAAAWEADIFPARVSMYDPAWLDVMCISGRTVWGRYTLPPPLSAVRAGKTTRLASPIKTTPVTLAMRHNSGMWRTLAALQGQERQPDNALTSNTAQRIVADLQQHGASFFADIGQRTGLLHSQLEQGLAELVSRGQVSSDSYTGLRALLTPDSRKPAAGRRHGARRASFGVEDAGRWSLLTPAAASPLDAEQLEELLMVYLHRWGVLFRQVLERESAAPPWRVLLGALKRLELRGTVRGGRFIAGVGGEQFALSETVNTLRRFGRDTVADRDFADARYCCLSVSDPANLLSVFAPGVRLPRLSRNRVLYKDGVALAVQESGNIHFLRAVPADLQWQLEQLLTRRETPPALRRYLGHR